MMAAGAVVVAMVIGVADGDTMTLQGGQRVRLEGIAAPEITERGGGTAADALRALAVRRQSTCTAAGYRSYDREVMTCVVDGLDLGQVMIAIGLARACHVRGARRYPQTMDRVGAVPRELPGYCR